MRKYIYIGCGASVGAILRHLLAAVTLPGYREKLPLDTLMINVSGAFIMAFLLTVAFEIWAFSPDIRLGLTTGALGAYTTFSTLCKETSLLLFQGDYFSAVTYLTISAALGLGAAYFGTVVAREVGSKLLRRGRQPENAQEKESGVD